MEERAKNWIEEMIERESTPKRLREQSTRDFCKERGIPESSYYYEVSKKEHQERILEICLNLAKRFTPDILENLGERATKDNKATELFLEYVLNKSKNIDIKSGGEKIMIQGIEMILPSTYENNVKTNDKTIPSMGSVEN